MEDFPMPEDFEEILSPLIIPLSLDEYWHAFYSDDAPYDIEEFRNIHNKKDVIINSTKWFTPNETEFMMSLGKRVI